MAGRPTYVSDGIFYGAMCWLLAGVFAVGIGFAYVRLGDGGLVGGFMIAGIIIVGGGWLLTRFASGGDLPPPNTVKINPRPAPTVPRSRAAERRAEAAAPALPERMPTAHEAGVAVGAAARSAADAVRGAASDLRVGAADMLRPGSEEDAGPATTPGEAPAAAPGEAADGREPRKPPTLEAPREGGGDDLLAIRGIGPVLASALNDLGYYHYDQIAAWSPEEVAWIDANVEGAAGRASREDWVGQARTLESEADTGQH